MQNWDGIFRFDWSNKRKTTLHKEPIQDFSIAQDAVSLLAERIINLMYLRGDVKTAETAVAWPYGPSYWKRLKPHDRPSTIEVPDNFTKLGFYCRIGVLREDLSMPGIMKLNSHEAFLKELTPAERKAIAGPVFVCQTNQISYDAKGGTFKVVTLKLESLTVEQGDMTGRVLTVKDADSFQVVTAAALDGEDLRHSGRIILFHQSNVSNKYMRFTSNDMCTVEDWGRNAQLIRRARAKLELSLAGKAYKVSAVGLNGRTKAVVPAVVDGGRLSFNADTSFFGGTMVYLIEKAVR